MPNKKNDYSDLKEEQEAEAYNRIRPIPTEKQLEIERNIEELSKIPRPHWERLRRIEDYLFVKYCNKHNLSDKQIEELKEQQFQKELFNGNVWGSHVIMNPNPETKWDLSIKWLTSIREEGYVLHQTNVEWLCMGLGCNNKTDLLVSGPHASWNHNLCPRCYEEFKALLKSKPYYTW